MSGMNLNKPIALYGGTWRSKCDQFEITKQHFVTTMSIYMSIHTYTHICPHTHIHLFWKPYDLSGVPPAQKIKSLFPLGLINLKAVVLKKNKKATGNICVVFFRGTKCFPLREECEISVWNLKSYFSCAAFPRGSQTTLSCPTTHRFGAVTVLACLCSWIVTVSKEHTLSCSSLYFQCLVSLTWSTCLINIQTLKWMNGCVGSDRKTKPCMIMAPPPNH